MSEDERKLGQGHEDDKKKDSVLEELKRALAEMLRKLREKLNRPEERRPEKSVNLAEGDIPPLEKAYERIVAAAKKEELPVEQPPDKEAVKADLQKKKEEQKDLLKKVEVDVLAESPKAAAIVLESASLSSEARNDPAYWIAKQAELPRATDNTPEPEARAIRAASLYIQKQLNKALDTNPPYREEYQHIYEQMTAGTPKSLEAVVQDLGKQEPPAVEKLEEAAAIRAPESDLGSQSPKVQADKKPQGVWPPSNKGSYDDEGRHHKTHGERRSDEKEAHELGTEAFRNKVAEAAPPPPLPPPEKPFAESLADMTPFELKEEYKRLLRQKFMFGEKRDQFLLSDEKRFAKEIEDKLSAIRTAMQPYVDELKKTELGEQAFRKLEVYKHAKTAAGASGWLGANEYTEVWKDMVGFMTEESRRIDTSALNDKLRGVTEYAFLDLLGEYGVEKANIEAICKVMGVDNVTDLQKATYAQIRALGLEKDVSVQVRKEWDPKLNDGKGDWVYETYTVEKYLEKIDLATSKGWGEAISDLILRNREAADKFMQGMEPSRREQFRSMYIHPEDQKRFRETIINAAANGEDIEQALKLWMQETIDSLMVATNEPIRAHPESQQRLTGLMFLISDVDTRYLRENFVGISLDPRVAIEPRLRDAGIDHVRIPGTDRIREQLINRLSAAEDIYNAGYMQTTGGAHSFKDMVQVIHRMQFRQGMHEIVYETKDRWGNRTVADGWRFMNKHLPEILGKNGDESVQHRLQFKFMKQLYGNNGGREALTFSSKELEDPKVQNTLKILTEGPLRLTNEQIASWWELDEQRFSSQELEALMDLMQLKEGTLLKQYRAASYGLKLGEALGYVLLENHARQYDAGYGTDGGGADWARRLYRPAYWMMRWGQEGNVQHDQILIKREYWQTYDLLAQKMETRDTLKALLDGKHIDPKKLRRISHKALHHLEHLSPEQKQHELDELLAQNLPANYIQVGKQFPHWITTTFEVGPTRIINGEGWRFEADIGANGELLRNNELAKNTEAWVPKGITPLSAEDAKSVAKVRAFRRQFTIHMNPIYRNEYAHAFVRTKVEHNAQMYGYYKVYEKLKAENLSLEQLANLGINGPLTYQSVAEMDFTKSEATRPELYTLYKDTFQATLAGKTAPGDNPNQQGLKGPDRLIQSHREKLYRGTDAEKRIAEDFMKNSGFVVEFAETVAPLDKVWIEYMNWQTAPEDFARRAYRDNDGLTQAFHENLLSIVQSLGLRPELVAKAIELFDRGTGLKGHKGSGEHQAKIGEFISLAISLHKARIPVRGADGLRGMLDPRQWGSNGLLGRRNMEDWEYKGFDPEIDLTFGTQRELDERNSERFSYIPLVGSVLRDDDGTPRFQRSEASDRTNEPAWTANEIWGLIHHAVENNQINAKIEHWLRSQHKGQVSEIRAALEDALSPLNIFAGSFEMLKKFKQDIDRAFDGGGGSGGGH